MITFSLFDGSAEARWNVSVSFYIQFARKRNKNMY